MERGVGEAEVTPGKRNGVKLALGMIAGAAIGGAGFYVARFVLRDATGVRDLARNVSGVWAAASIIFGVTLPLFLHEAGHLIGGKLVGFRFALYAAGPIMITREGERLKFQFHRHWTLYGGVAASMPVDDRDLLRRMSWMVAAGPLMSLGVAAAALGAAMLVGATHPGPRFFLFTMGLSSAMNFLAVTIPSKTGGFLTDRARFLLLRRGGPEAELAAASALLNARNMAGERPRNWPASAVATVERAGDAKFDSLMGQFSHVVRYYEDTGRLPEALERLETVVRRVDLLPPILQPMIWLERAYLTAIVKRDAAQAREDLGRVGARALVESWDRQRAEAAILLAEGNASAARELARSALTQIGATTQYGTTRLGRDQLEAMVC